MSDESFRKSAHDLNNILTSIVNGIELLKQSASNNKETEVLISKLENSAKRAAKIVHSHLSSNQPTKKDYQKVNIKDLVTEVVESFYTNEQKLIQIRSVEYVPHILIDETDFYRIMHNLIKNALEAIDENGKIEISLSNEITDGKSYAQIKIVDNGTGINKEHLSKIFEPKFSTKTKEHDSGFGLSIVKEKTEDYGGSISVESKKGKTEFTVLFPAYDVEAHASKSILLAEDDLSVSDVLADLLKSQGYSVSIAATGNEAIREINNKLFDALIIDKKMPEMDGIECIKNVRTSNSKIPIILASGEDIDIQSDDLQNLNVGWVIKKPYNFPEILSALQKFDL